MFRHLFNKLPILLLVLIITVILMDPLISLSTKQILYALSLSIKSVIIFLLPLIIFGLLFKAMVMLSNSATRIIGLILAGVCLSNFCATFLSHYVGEWIYHFDLSIISPDESLNAKGLEAAWIFTLPKLIPNDVAMFSGLILGILAGFLKKPIIGQFAAILEKIISKILGSFVYFIPLFVVGFVVKLQHDDVISLIIQNYTLIFIIIAAVQFFYISLAYLSLNGGKISKAIGDMKNMIPAAISGFSTMSSAASMPLTIIGVKNNAKDKDLASSVVPATVNIHLIGDCIAIPILAYAVLKNYGMVEPSLYSYLIFTLYFVLAKFSVASIPGGGIIVMLPVLETYLGFNSSMMSLITALYILFDPVITCVNILGNGAFAKMIELIGVQLGMGQKSMEGEEILAA